MQSETGDDDESSLDFSLIDGEHNEEEANPASKHQWPNSVSHSAIESRISLADSYHELHAFAEAHEDHHCTETVRLEERHAVEIQELLKAQAVLEEGLSQSARRQSELLLQEKEDLQAQLVDVSRIRDSLSVENNRLSREVEHRSSEAQEAQAKLTNSEKERIELLTSRDSLFTELEEQRCELATLRTALDRLSKESHLARAEANTESALFRSQFEIATHELHMARMHAKSSAEEVLTLTRARDSIEADIDVVNRELDGLKSTLESTITDFTTAVAAVDSLHGELDMERERCRSALEDLKTFKSERDDLIASQAPLAAWCSEITTHNSQLSTALEISNQELHAVSAELDSLRRAKGAQDAKIRDLRAQLFDARSIEESFRQKYLEQRGAKEKAEKSLHSALSQNDATVAEAKKAFVAIHEEKRELTKLHAKEIKSVKAEMQATAEAARISLQAEVNELTRRVDEKDRKILRLRSERDALKQGNGLRDDHLRARLVAAESERDALKQDIDTEQRRIRKLQARLSAV